MSVHASLTFGNQHWAVTWDENSNTEAYMVAQFAFEAKRAAEREQQCQHDGS